MPDETFRPRRPNQPKEIDDQENATNMESLDFGSRIRQQAAAEETNLPKSFPQTEAPGGIKMTGNIPPEILQAMRAASGENLPEPKKGFGQMKKETDSHHESVSRHKETTSLAASNDHLKELLATLKNSSTVYEEIELPSKGRFYDGETGPANGIVAVRPMTGEEEQILATPRFVRRGQAINMIFQKCLRDGNTFRPENLLTIDRTYLLIYLRGISYSTKYEVEVKCPDCEKKFGTTINLDEMAVDPCPDEYGPILQDVLPTTKLPFTYRLSTGKDEQDITDYRDRRIKAFGDSSADDTLTYRTATLLNEIDGIKGKNDLQVLLKNLPINDVSYIRNCINEPPFGVDTNIEITCPSCLHDFEVDLPLEASFFFPRRKKVSHQA